MGFWVTGLFLLLAVASVPAAPAAAATERMDRILRDLNEASPDTSPVIVMSCFQFHPDVAGLLSGETITWQWADACGLSHTVTSSGTTFDPAEDLNKPEPQHVGECFDSSLEPPGRFLSATDPVYPVTLHFAGILVRDLLNPTSEFFKPCVLDNSVSSTAAIVPYLCRIHGFNPGTTMRGALIITL